MVIKEWLKGNHRDRIATQMGLSGGTVSNIIREWRDDLANYGFDETREFSVMCRKAGITPSQCVPSLRMIELIRRMGLDEEDIHFFTRSIYMACKEAGLREDRVALLLSDLAKLCDRITIDQLPIYLEQIKDEKENLEKEVKSLRAELASLQDRHTSTSCQYNAHRSEIMLTSSLKEEMGRHGISLNRDIPKLIQTIHHISNAGFDVNKIISMVSTIESMEKKKASLQADVHRQEEQATQLQMNNSLLLNSVNSHRQLISVYHQLQSMGFGLRELDLLVKTVNEIAQENGFSPQLAVTRFIEDVTSHYRYVGGFESRIEELRKDTEHTQYELAILRSTAVNWEQTHDATSRLLSLGLDSSQIVSLANKVDQEMITNKRIDRQHKHQEEREQHKQQGPPYQQLHPYAVENKDTCIKGDSSQPLRIEKQSHLLDDENKLLPVSGHLKDEFVTQVISVIWDIRVQMQKQFIWSCYCASIAYNQMLATKSAFEKEDKVLLPLAATGNGNRIPFNDLKKSVIFAIQSMIKELNISEHGLEAKDVAKDALYDAETVLQQMI